MSEPNQRIFDLTSISRITIAPIMIVSAVGILWLIFQYHTEIQASMRTTNDISGRVEMIQQSIQNIADSVNKRIQDNTNTNAQITKDIQYKYTEVIKELNKINHEVSVMKKDIKSLSKRSAIIEFISTGKIWDENEKSVK